MDPLRAWTLFFVGASFALYLFIAWRARVKTTRGFYVAGQGVPATANGMATAADWMSAASFIGMTGLISSLGFAGCVYLMGWTGGYVLLALLLAPYLRKFGRYTVPDFVGDRYTSANGRGDLARLTAVVCAIFVSFTYVAGQMRGAGIVFARFLDVDVTVGVVIGMAVVFVYATLGGMKGITWTQVAQYWVLITAFLTPVIAISLNLTGTAAPQLGLVGDIEASGQSLLGRLDGLHEELGFAPYTTPFAEASGWDKLNVFCVALALMAGTAGLPHVIVRFYTVKNVRAARWSAFWALLFIAALYLSAPAAAAFVRYYMFDTLHGKQFVVDAAEAEARIAAAGGDPGDAGLTYVEPDAPAEGQPAEPPFYSELPGWFHNWKRTGLVGWLDDGDGLVAFTGDDRNEVFNPSKRPAGPAGDDLLTDHAVWLATQGEQGADARPAMTAAKAAGPDRDIFVLAMPEMAGLADWIVAFVAAGALAAALSTASGLLLVISSSVAHDLYYRTLRPNASEKSRLLVGRAAIGVAVVIAGLFGIYPPGFVSQVVAFAFGLAASSFFPAIVLGIFTKRVGAAAAVPGMIVGLGFTGTYIIGNVYAGWEPWCFGIKAQGIGTVGMALNFAVTLALTPLTPKPPASVQAEIDRVREPELLSDANPAVDIDAAPEH
ncbi:MAG: sodium:solute symporter family protein [Planctomycetota bacterium]